MEDEGTAQTPASQTEQTPDLQTIILGSLRIFAAIVIFYAFIVILMTAIAQQTVITELSEGGSKLSYSSAYELVRSFEARQAGVPDLRKRRTRLGQDQDSTTDQLGKAQSEYDAAWRSVMPLVRRLVAACRIEPVAQPDTSEARMNFWSDAVQCRADVRLPPSLEAAFGPLADAKRNFMQVAQEYVGKRDELNRLDSQLTNVDKQIATELKGSEEESRAKQVFDVSSVLRNSWMLGGSFFLSFPPSLLQLVLSAAAGAFGALLIILVLVVYPRSSFDVASAGSYEARTLLGAVIAVCVYIMLLGGTAVLGSTGAINGAGSNYMASCAVAVLAGMFSDRVADWLSDRANTFFKQNA